MTTSTNRAIDLSFAQAVSVLMEACELPKDARTAFEARIRHLQRLGVPPRVPGERPSGIAYGIAELAVLATAFRLMAAFMMPALAARYVTERWTELAPFALAGARDVIPGGYLSRRPMRNDTIAMFEGNALADLGRGRHDQRNTVPLGRITLTDAEATNLPLLVQGGGIVLDSRSYMPIIVTRSVMLALATDADLAEELDRLRFVS